jgi:hypothetical protein
MSKIKEKTEDDDSFHVVWLQLIKTIQSTSIERFEDLKTAIKAHHPSQYAGENLEALAVDYRKDARELTTAGQYDHNLTLTKLKTFLLAGGAGNEDFRFPLRSTKQKLDQALLDIGNKEKSGAHAHMVAEKLTFQDICRQAEDAYRTECDRKEWPPASHTPDVRAPLATFGNVAAAPAGISRAEVLMLIQSQASGADAPTKKGNCHSGGKPGHWANKCPELTRKSGSSSSSGSRQDRTNKHKPWRTTSPLLGTGSSKKVKDKTFNWCEKCCRWTVTHTTTTHTGAGERRPPVTTPSPRANLSRNAPSTQRLPRLLLSLALNVVVSLDSSKSRSLRHASIRVFAPTSCIVPTLSVSDKMYTLHRALPRLLSARTFVTSQLSRNVHCAFNVAPTSSAIPHAPLP